MLMLLLDHIPDMLEYSIRVRVELYYEVILIVYYIGNQTQLRVMRGEGLM